jgi:isoleucyl-tRNA synthetase
MKLDFTELEEKTLKFWRQDRTFEKSVQQRAKSKAPRFIFYEGPPTANAKPGIHHILARINKDIICRYKTMKGFLVERKAGWDTHGLPVELEIEKKLGLKSKKDIEKYGIAKFNGQCKKSVWMYKRDWEKLTERIGYWLDMKNPYITYDNSYIESVWNILKIIYQRGLMYQDYKVVPYCYRCGTSLSSHEVALGYKKVKEKAVYISFKLKPKGNIWPETSILSWTTTPWTLPGNVALAVNPGNDYIRVPDPVKKGSWIVLGLNNFQKLLETDIFPEEYRKEFKLSRKKWSQAEIFKGKKLLKLEYQPLFDVSELKSSRSYRIYPADFVTSAEGTGVVHTAVMYGEDDYELGKRESLPFFHTVDEEGKFIFTLKEGLGGKQVKEKDTELLILELLKKKNFFFAEEIYEHDYPFCWRCASPLLYYAKQSWFVNMQKIKKDLIRSNQKVNWIPGHLKKGRMGEWLKEVKDWAFSRERYWATPLPVWKCEKCGRKEIIGGEKELFSKKFSGNNYYFLRHGESLRQKKDIAVCFPEKIHCPLTKKGRQQIREAAKSLKDRKINLIFSSDLLRTKETAEIVGQELGIKAVFDKRLREFNVGSFNGKPVKLFREYFQEDESKRFDKKVPGGENYRQVKKRMYGFLKETDEKYKDKNILIISHESPLTLLEGALKGVSEENFLSFRRKAKLGVGQFKKVEFKQFPYNKDMQIDFHRPYIDEVRFFCPECGGKMERVKEVVDCWFDSGSMPFAQSHWPFSQKQKEKPPVLFPADYISEAIDQTRGWFYTLQAVSNLLNFGPAFKNVISLGHILDEKGEKMSKSKGNIVDPWEIIGKYGADAVRWHFFTLNQPGDSKLFSEKELQETLKRFNLIIWNSLLFFETYKETFKKGNLGLRRKGKDILEEWIISKINSLNKKVSEELDGYQITNAARLIEKFLIEDFSQWYIRRSRRKFQRPKNKNELKESLEILNFLLNYISKIISPFVPFLAERIYSSCPDTGKKKSVHLAGWPKAEKTKIKPELEKEMEVVRKISSLGLKVRAEKRIKVRQPLADFQFSLPEGKISPKLIWLLKEELNIKEVKEVKRVSKGGNWAGAEAEGIKIALNMEISPELRKEGIIKEFLRFLQDMRKSGKFKPKDKIVVRYSGTEELNGIIEANKKEILEESRAVEIKLERKVKEAYGAEKEAVVGENRIWLGIKKFKF